MGIENTGNIVLIIGEWTRKNVGSLFPMSIRVPQSMLQTSVSLGFSNNGGTKYQNELQERLYYSFSLVSLKTR